MAAENRTAPPSATVTLVTFSSVVILRSVAGPIGLRAMAINLGGVVLGGRPSGDAGVLAEGEGPAVGALDGTVAGAPDPDGKGDEGGEAESDGAGSGDTGAVRSRTFARGVRTAPDRAPAGSRVTRNAPPAAAPRTMRRASPVMTARVGTSRGRWDT
ncbi:hypothetical protein GCM10022226_15740 [Sphaerisporangium flaviroseum]|uniref:Uncharacterized protein n=1 Tax=Sphaerisporangium flaviroseum TaxID=509199 RepID=A0ABP7HQP7_9ACTN